MEVQNITGSDVIVQKFSSEVVQRNEQAPEQKNESNNYKERSPEPGKGANIDRLA